MSDKPQSVKIDFRLDPIEDADIIAVLQGANKDKRSRLIRRLLRVAIQFELPQAKKSDPPKTQVLDEEIPPPPEPRPGPPRLLTAPTPNGKIAQNRANAKYAFDEPTYEDIDTP